MKLSDYLVNEELARLTDSWRRLTWLQRKLILLHALPHFALLTLNNHIELRRARFAYLYSAHWVSR